jgi:hypothetical protein
LHYGKFLRAASPRETGLPDQTTTATDFLAMTAALKSWRSLSTVNHKKPIVKAMLKLASSA